MSNEKREGQSGVRVLEGIKRRFPDTGWAFTCFGVSVAIVVIAGALSYARSISDGFFAALLCAAFVVFFVPMVVGVAVKSQDDRRVNARTQKQIDICTPSTSATRTLANMSYEEMLAQDAARNSAGDQH